MTKDKISRAFFLKMDKKHFFKRMGEPQEAVTKDRIMGRKTPIGMSMNRIYKEGRTRTRVLKSLPEIQLIKP